MKFYDTTTMESFSKKRITSKHMIDTVYKRIFV